MPTYGGIQKEETLKGLAYSDYFPKFGYEPDIDNIDFVITDKEASHYRYLFPAEIYATLLFPQKIHLLYIASLYFFRQRNN